jgi:uncharacterized protein
MKCSFILPLFAFVLVSSFGQSTIESIPNQKLINNSYVSNPDNILNQATTAQIDSILSSLEKKTSAQVAVVAVSSIGDQDVFEFAQKLFDKWGIGSSGNDNGLLILLVEDNHTVRFHTGYGLEGMLPDAVCKRIQRDYMLPHFRNADYSSGMLEGIQQVEKILSDPAYAEEIKQGENAEVVSDYTGFIIFLSIFMAPVIIIIFLVKAGNGRFADSKKPSYTLYPETRLKRFTWLAEFAGIPILFVILFGLSDSKDAAAMCVITLYLYYMATVFHKLLRTNKVIKRFMSEENYYEITTFLKSSQTYWFFMGLLFPLPFMLYFFYHLARKRVFRNHPRKCKLCQAAMHKLSEQEDDQYLTKSQQMEETLKSVDYDVWKCEACQATEEWIYPNKWSKYKECSYCKTHASYLASRNTVVSPTYSSSGSGEEVNTCKFCGKSKKTAYSIPMLTRSSSGSGSSSGSSSRSGSWGGGRSGGGGASSSW